MIMFFIQSDTPEFERTIQSLHHHILSLDFIFDEKIDEINTFNALLRINDNYLSTKDQQMRNFHGEILLRAKIHQKKSESELRPCIEYQKNEWLQIQTKYADQDQKKVLNKNTLDMIEQLRQVGMNRDAHVYSTDIAQSMWFTNQLKIISQGSIQHEARISDFRELLQNDKKQLEEMKAQIKSQTVRKGEIIMNDTQKIRRDWFNSQFNLEY